MKKRLLLMTLATLVLLAGCGNTDTLDQDTNSQDTQQELVDKANQLIEEGRKALFGLDGAEVDYDTAMKCFVDAAAMEVEETGEANYYIGHMYESGYGVLTDYETAYTYLSKAAECNNAKAMYALGRLHYYGQYVKENVEVAKGYFETAIENGFLEAKEGLSTIAYGEGDYTLAETLALEVIEKGSEQDIIALSMLCLVDLYTEEATGLLDYAKAYEWCEKATTLNYSYAYNYMGILYHYGYGVEKDQVEALKWYEKGAQYGCASSFNNLGNAYRYEYGVDYDPHKAIGYYEEAAKRESASACYNLGTMYFGRLEYRGENQYLKMPNDIERDDAKAFTYFEQAAEQGHVDAMYHVGYMYESGISITQNNAKALEWYEKAAKEGHAVSMRVAALLYYSGEGGVTDYDKSFEWMLKSAERGDGWAAYNVAIFYQKGKVVERDYDEALKWAEKALELEISKAKDLIKEIKKQKK